jgi:hypothetical protein
LGSLVIGFLASEEQAMGIKPFTTDMFKGILSIFLLDMGIVAEENFKIYKSGWFAVLLQLLSYLLNGCIVALCSTIITDSIKMLYFCTFSC